MPAGKFRGSGIECVPINLIRRSQSEGDRPSKNCLCKEIEEDRSEDESIALIKSLNEEKPLIILIDMDNTLNDWDRQFRRLCAYYYPEMPELEVAARKHYHMELNLEAVPELEKYRDAPLEFTELDGFWREMPPAEGAYKAVFEMLELDLLIFIVSKPDGRFLGRSCQEKAHWLERNFGDTFKSRLILSCDKSVIRGDILIDDNPRAAAGCGGDTDWVHVFYCQPYNCHAGSHYDKYRVHSWTTWLRDIQPALKEVRERRRLE